jgi:predicted transcriptional regulator
MVKIQSHASLRAQMTAVARGAQKAPRDAAVASFESAAAVLRVLTLENRKLLAAIRDRHPQSIAELASMTGRAQPNLTRTLAKLEALGFVRLESVDNRKVPTTSAHSLKIDVDLFSPNDRLEMV